MACNSCGKKKNTCDNKEFTKAVVEINNPETNVLIRKVVIPTSLGDDVTNPPSIGRYCNVVLYYEANQHIYLYSSDGIPTLISDNGDVDFNYIQNRPWYNGAPMTSDTRIPKVPTAVSELNNDRNYQTASQVSTTVNTAVAGEKTARQNADNTLQTNINNEKTARQNADITLQNNITAEATARGNADTALQNSINAEVLARQNAINTLTTEINRDVMYDLEMSTSAQSVSFQEDKINVVTGQTKTEIDTIPAASTTTAGIITAAEYTTLVDAEEKINALLDGAVAITGISANPSQQDLTTAWKNATGRDELINRASIFDVDNQLVWTYYTNASLWESVPAGGQVTINQFENGVAGTITGSTLDGNVSANLDGTGSVSGWTTVKNDIATNTAAIATKANITDIPTVNNATLTIQKNGSNVATFTANSATNATANISVPTKTSDLTNDSNFVNTTQLATKQDVLTAGNAIDITSNVISANVHPADFFTNDATDSDKGNPLYFEGTTEEKLANIMLEGDTDQTTYSGKNKFNSYRIPDYEHTSADVVITAGPDGTIYMSNNPANNGYCRIYSSFKNFAPALRDGQTYYIYVNNTFESGSRNYIYLYGSNTFWYSGESHTVTQAELDANITIYGGYQSATNMKIMITDALDSNYEQYVGGIASPNPDYPQDVINVTGEQVVKITGKNLLDNQNPTVVTSPATWTPTQNGGTYTSTQSWKPVAWNFVLEEGASYKFRYKQRPSNDFYVYIFSYTDDTYSTIKTRFVQDGNATQYSFTPDSPYVNVRFMSSAAVSNLSVEDIQLEKSTSVTEYEPYEDQEYTINLGKNLLNLATFVKGRVDNGVIGYAEGTDSFSWTDDSITFTTNTAYRGIVSALIPVHPNTRYLISAENPISRLTDYYDATGTWISRATSNPISTPYNCHFIRVSYQPSTAGTYTVQKPQVELGTERTSFVSYKTPMELCKIGSYQDYFYKDGSSWYLHKEIGKMLLNGTGDYGTLGDGTGGTKRFRFNESTVGNIDVQTRGIYSDKYQGVRYSASPATPNSISQWKQENMLAITTNKTTYSLNDFKADLASNPVTVYYVLATETNTQITDTELVEQLNTLWYEAHSYEGVTWLSAQSNGVDLPFIIDATVVENSLAGVNYAIDNKQDILTAGDNITITNNVISASVPTVNNATLIIQKNGTNVATFTANSSTNATANITVPTITMTNVDPGEGSPLAANNFIAVYEA